MARNYSEEEKQKLLDKYKVSGKSKTTYARENGIPEVEKVKVSDRLLKNAPNCNI